MTTKVRVYAIGIVSASACAPYRALRVDVARSVNAQHPTGISPWTIAPEPFATGEPNPCPCNDNPERQHWLLHC